MDPPSPLVCVHTYVCVVTSDIFDFLQQGNEADQYLAQLALRSVQGKPNEKSVMES